MATATAKYDVDTFVDMGSKHNLRCGRMRRGNIVRHREQLLLKRF